MRKLVVIIAALSVFVLPAMAGDPALRDMIQGENDRMAAAFNAGRASDVRAMYTEEATVLPSGGEMVGGTHLLPFWRAVVGRIGRWQRTTIEVEALGPEALREIGTFTFVVKREIREVSGKYVVVWRKVDGAWKLDTDIWNTDR